ncbi:hypothetical protein LguiB_020672 [Lonicera macranthoides]
MEEEELEECNTSLNLGIGLGEYVATKNNAKQKKNNKRGDGVCMDFSLFPQLVHRHQPKEEVINIDDEDDGLIKDMHQLVWGSKRKIEEEEQDDKKSSSSNKNNNNIDEYYYSNDIHNNISKKENNCGRKKLRLNKDQSTLLEDSFKQHTSLNAVIFLSFIFIFLQFIYYFFLTFIILIG